ncbi:hypothetical protein HPB48_022817 [Haemaphysalis longicornis]|uniref:Phosphotyrosine protein phosphatase I domain-containing protein n=1 Tax=Haemaphysalis longicornis TaxID=44386 RepID=A0A9J6FXE9_HAELO|nr:hypothetical protein HPB48_022817 [Haemaphysalis longicornis]
MLWEVDSAATGEWHVGKKPDKRAIQCMQDHCVEMDHRARLVRSSDFRHFQYIFGMDEANMRDLRALAPSDSTAQIEMLGSYDPEGKSVIRDPYYVRQREPGLRRGVPPVPSLLPSLPGQGQLSGAAAARARFGGPAASASRRFFCSWVAALVGEPLLVQLGQAGLGGGPACGQIKASGSAFHPTDSTTIVCVP